jgi:hypothetical protein
MKSRLFLRPIVCLTVLFFVAARPSWGTIVTFDDLSETGTGSFVPTGYQGLIWSNFWCFNAILATNRNEVGVSGTYYGMVSASNVAYNPFAAPVEVDSPSTNFSFLSAYMTGAWNSNLNIEIQGFRSGTLVYDTTVVAGATNPTLFTFNYLNVDRLYFNSFGGQPAFGTVPNTIFVMDNFTFEFVPEPSSLLLTAGGVLTLWAFVKGKRPAGTTPSH